MKQEENMYKSKVEKDIEYEQKRRVIMKNLEKQKKE